jgi:hypothetical protein
MYKAELSAIQILLEIPKLKNRLSKVYLSRNINPTLDKPRLNRFFLTYHPEQVLAAMFI